MKRKTTTITAWIIAAICFTALCFAGCASPADGAFSAEDAALVFDGVSVRRDDVADDIVKALGTDYEYSEAISCSYSENGMDKCYDYGDTIVATCPLHYGKDYILSLETSSTKFRTAGGISVGDSITDIEKAYGKDHHYENGVLIYYSSSGDVLSERLYFIIENDAVSAIGIA